MDLLDPRRKAAGLVMRSARFVLHTFVFSYLNSSKYRQTSLHETTPQCSVIRVQKWIYFIDREIGRAHV